MLILHSTTAIAWGERAYDRCLDDLFTALSFTGVRVGFITERVLEAGELPHAKVLFVPDVTHFSQSAFAALAKWREGAIVLVGGSPLSRDEYDAAYPPLERPKLHRLRCTGEHSWKELWEQVN